MHTKANDVSVLYLIVCTNRAASTRSAGGKLISLFSWVPISEWHTDTHRI